MDKQKNDLLTVKEFAEAAGVSRQAIYQQIDKSLKDFVKVVDGKKHVEKEALMLYSVNKVDSDVDKSVKEDFTKLPTVDELAAQEEMLYNEQLIAELTARIESLERDKERLYSLLEEKEKSLQQAQALHLGTQTGTFLEEDTQVARKGIFARIFKK